MSSVTTVYSLLTSHQGYLLKYLIPLLQLHRFWWSWCEVGPKSLHFRLVPPPGNSGTKWAQGQHFQSRRSVGLSPPGRLWLGGLNPRDSVSVGPGEGHNCQLGFNQHPGEGAGRALPCSPRPHLQTPGFLGDIPSSQRPQRHSSKHSCGLPLTPCPAHTWEDREGQEAWVLPRTCREKKRDPSELIVKVFNTTFAFKNPGLSKLFSRKWVMFLPELLLMFSWGGGALWKEIHVYM